jgi:hypothetical protein
LVKLALARTLSLPIDAATQTFAFIARKGAGKTYAAGKLVELLLAAHVQVVVLDTVGNWYGLRLNADGKRAGFDVPVLGGLRGDIPLEAAGGAVIADLVVDTGRSIVLDVSQFSLGDRKRFAVTFGERLWLRKKGEARPRPLHLVIEESQLIVPQFTGRGGDEARMVGVFEEIIRLGRNYGIGVSMITQRPQSVNKEVLNQTECLLVGQVNGSQERAALKKWITHQGMDVGLVDELPALKIGTFYVWSPQWLNILEKVEINKKHTFDASATPKVGDRRVRRSLKPLNLSDLRERMQETIAKAAADDPRELRKQIAALTKANKDLAATVPAINNVRVNVPVLKARDTARLVKATDRIATLLEGPAGKMLDDLKVVVSGIRVSLESFEKAQHIARGTDGSTASVRRPSPPLVGHGTRGVTTQTPPVRGRPAVPRRGVEGTRAANGGDSGDTDVKGGKFRAMMVAMAQAGRPLTEAQLAIRAEMSVSGTFDTYIGRMRRRGWIAGTRTGLTITQAGLDALGFYEPLPRGEGLRAYWLGQMGGKQREMLSVLISAYPDTMEEHDLATCAGMAVSGTFDTYIGRLRRLQLVEGSRKALKAADELFEE